MARLFALLGNRADLAGRVLACEAPALRVTGTGAAVGWGVGFHQGGEVLMRRRPIDERAVVDVAGASSDVRGDVVLGHVGRPSLGGLRTENTHPFRYRQWLFAQTGTLPVTAQVRERLLAEVPDFLRAGIRGDTDSEVVFHVLLSFLHDAGRLVDGPVPATAVGEALRATLRLVDQVAAELGGEPAQVNWAVATPDVVVALARGATMAHRTFAGRADADLVLGDDAALRRRTPELGHLHFVLLASDFDDEARLGAAWTRVPTGSLVALTRGAAPEVEAL